MPFGVFVELAPDCGGLVHVSRITDTYVEDLHEAVQVGDVITAWVTGIDDIDAVLHFQEFLGAAERKRATVIPSKSGTWGTWFFRW